MSGGGLLLTDMSEPAAALSAGGGAVGTFAALAVGELWVRPAAALGLGGGAFGLTLATHCSKRRRLATCSMLPSGGVLSPFDEPVAPDGEVAWGSRGFVSGIGASSQGGRAQRAHLKKATWVAAQCNCRLARQRHNSSRCPRCARALLRHRENSRENDGSSCRRRAPGYDFFALTLRAPDSAEMSARRETSAQVRTFASPGDSPWRKLARPNGQRSWFSLLRRRGGNP